MSKPDPETIETLRGYHDGFNDKPYDDGSSLATQAVTLGVAGQPREGAYGNYGPAYKQGQDDRKNRR